MVAAAVQRPGAPPPPPKQRYQGVQKESAGYRLLSAMGWREGEGLGASKQGIKSHIRVKKNYENWGVGAVEAAEHTQNWTNGMLDFHRVLSNLSEVVSEHAKRRTSASSSTSEDDSDASDGEKRGQPKQLKATPNPQVLTQAEAGGKKRKQPAASSSSSSEDEDEEAALAAPKRFKAATHIGRFKKREAAKMVKGYSEQDLAAILGADPFAAVAAAVPEVKAQQPQQRQVSSSGYESDESSGEERASGKRRQQQQVASGKAGQLQAQAQAEAATEARQEMIVVRRPMMLAGRPAVPAPRQQEGLQPGWWQVCFHRAAGPRGVGAGSGQVGAGEAAGNPATINIHGFSEQDQTNLYNLAHDKATQGRVGLGRSSMPKKVAGARWEGKKTRIGDSDDDSGDEQQRQQDQEKERVEVGQAPAGVELEREEGLVIIVPASKRHLVEQLQAGHHHAGSSPQQEQQQQADGSAGGKSGASSNKAKKKAVRKAAAAAAAGTQAEQQQQQQPPAARVQQQAGTAAAAGADASLASIKWKKAVSAALKASTKGRLKLGKLHRAIMKEQGVSKEQRGATLETLTAFLEQSTKFELRDGVVRAAAG